MIQLLQQQVPLAKPHSPWRTIWNEDTKPVVEQLVRICRRASFEHYSTQESVDQCKVWCDLHGAKLDFHYSPHVAGTVPPPTNDAAVIGWLGSVQNNLTEASAKLNGYPLETVFVDFESWHTSADPAHNQAMQNHEQTLTNLIEDEFPGVPIEYYGYGSSRAGATDTGYGYDNFFPHLGRLSRSVNCTIYTPWERRNCIEIGLRSMQGPAVAEGCEKLVPWVCLGSGWQRSMPNPENNDFQKAVQYSTGYSYLLGFAVNNPWANQAVREQRYGPFRFTDVVCLYPGFGFLDYPYFLEHFLQYAKAGV